MSGLAQLGTTGERSRRAQANLDRAASDLASALKRVLPFLTRKRVAVVAAPARTALFAELATAIPKLTFTMAVACGPNRTGGVIALDAFGAARLLDGTLGGGDVDPNAEENTQLSSAQSALAGRVVENVLKGFAEALKSRLGLVIEAMPGTATTTAGAAAIVTLNLAGGGAVSLALPLSVLDDSPAVADPKDTGMADAMIDVEVDVIAELGKVRLPLSRIAGLAVGDIVQLSLPLDERARVSAGGAVLFRGKPKSAGASIGIEIDAPRTSMPVRP